MKTSEVIELADNLADAILDTEQWVALINLCLNDLTPVAKILKAKKGIEVTLTDGNGSIDIADDEALNKAHEIRTVYINGRQLRRLPQYDRLSMGWHKESDCILIQGMPADMEIGTVDVYYYERLPHVRIPDELQGIDDDIPLPEEYCNLVYLYIAAKSQESEEEIEDERNFWSLYKEGKQQFALDRIWEMEPENRPFIRQMRLQAQISGAK